MTGELHVARFADLDAATLYALLKLRSEIFVVEQNCVCIEPDGRDTEPDTWHLWLEEERDPIAYLRILSDPDGEARIGRVCVTPAARGAGHARTLVAAALDLAYDRACVLESQAYLVEFYEQFGFTTTGPAYDDDGILHVPMARALAGASP